MALLRLVGLVSGEETEFDGKYVVEYDPRPRIGVDNETFVHLIVTDDPAKARHFASSQEAVNLYLSSVRRREDGEPDRPLTVFSVEVLT